MFGKSWEMIKRGMAVALSVSLLAGAMSVSSSLPTAAASTKRVEVGTKGNVTINLDGREVWQAAADAMQKAQPVTGDIADRIMAQTGSNGNPVVLEDDIYKMELPAKALKGLPTGLGMEMYISAGAEDVAEDYTAAEEGEAAAVVAEVASASDLEATGVAEKPVRDFFASSMFSLIKENDEAAPAGGAAAAGGEGYELNGSEHIYFVLSNATDQDVNYTVKLGDLEILKTKVLKSHGDTTGVIGASVSDLIGVPASTSNMVRATESDMATASNLMEDAELTDDVVAKVVRTTLKNFFIIYRSEETALGTKAMVVTTADMKFKSKDGGVFTTRGDKMVLAVRDIDKNSEEYKQAAATLQNNNVDHADFAAVDISFRKGSADEDYEPCQGQIVNVRIETKAIENFDPESMSIQHHLDDGSLETVAGTTKKTVVEISDDAAEAVNNTVAVTEDQQTEITVEKKEDENVYTFDEEANKAAMEAQLSTAGKSEFKMEVGDGETALTNDVKESGAPKKASAAQTEVKKNSVTKTISSAVDANGVKTEVQEEQGNGDIKVEDGKVVADFVVDSFSIYTISAYETITTQYLASNGAVYDVSLTYEANARIPKGSTLRVRSIAENSAAYKEAKAAVVEAKKAENKNFDESAMGMAALDITIVDPAGNPVEPAEGAEVSVSLEMKELPENVDESVLRSTMEIQHLNESSGTVKVETVAEAKDVAVEDGSAKAEFTVTSFSIFTLTWGDNSATIHYGYMNGNTFVEFATDKTPFLDTTATSINLANNFDGYDYGTALLHNEETTNPWIDYVVDFDEILKKNGSGEWVYSGTSTSDEGESTTTTGSIPNGSHIYVIYTESAGGHDPAPEDVEGPKTTKTVTENGDGTYDIQLDILGAEKSETTQTGANVMIVLDTTGSMSGRMSGGGGTRIEAARKAMTTLIDALDCGTNDIDLSVVTFNNLQGTSTRFDWTKDYTSVRAWAVNAPSASGGTGTNWEAGLNQAVTVLNNNPDNDTTYVIFVTDGEPNRYVESYWGQEYEMNGGASTCRTQAQPSANILAEGAQFYGVLCGTTQGSDHLSTLVNNANGVKTIEALDEATLTSEFEAIATTIITNLGSKNVSVDDGIPSLSSVSAQTVGEASGFEYYIKAADDADFSKWNDAPGASYSKDNGVTWNLSSVGTLKAGTIYRVKFTVWPSQAALDQIADLNNGLITMTDAQLEAEGIDKVNGEYRLKTNTHLNTTFTYTNGETYTNPSEWQEEHMLLPTETISLQKIWPENMLDDYGAAQYRDADGNTQTATEITLNLTKAGQDYLDVIVKGSEGWKKDNIYISCGFMTVKDGVVDIKEPGFDYTITEPSAFSYYWDLIADVYHPMVINGTAHLLVWDESLTSADNVNTFEIAGKFYKVVSDTDNTLEGSNYRRSNLNITKALDGANAPKDQYFEYTVTVKDADSTDGYVWFSAWDPEASATVKATDWVISGATPQTGDTGYWYATNGSTVKFKIKADWNVRFLNLKHDSTFSVEETGVGEGFEFESLEGTTQYSLKSTERWHTDDGVKSTGSIIEPNNSYTITYTNKWKTQEVKLKKVDEKEGLLGGTKFTLSRYNEKSSAENKWEPLNADIAPGATEAENPVTIGNLGIGRYKLHETAAPENYDALPEDKDVYFSIYDNSGTLAIKLTNSEGADLSPARSDVTLEGNVITVSNQRKTTSLKITKTVSGKMGDKTEKFEFTLQLFDYSDGSPLIDCENSKNIAAENGKWTFELGHGEDIEFTGIPVGTKFTLKENKTLTQLYDTTYQVGTADPSKSAPEEVEILDATNVIVNNDRDATVPTGIYTDLNLWRWLIGACFLMFFGSALYGRRKRRQ